MGCAWAKEVGKGGDREKKPPDFEKETKPERSPDLNTSEMEIDRSVARRKLEGTPSRSHQAGFRHTSGLRVGVIESKQTSVTLLNDYIVLGGLGKGTYGSVKLCYSMQDDNLYALKVLQKAQLKRHTLGPRKGGSNMLALDMLRREVDVMRSMNHPNLIKIFEVIEADSKVVLVQEYAEAGPLQQPGQFMCESLAQYYFRQIVAGLSALHANNVVHGDMKPDNVLLAGSGLVKIADFGQAQFFNEGADVFDKTLGTPAFMAPEVRSGGAYHGKPADMWALGITLYCFLFANLPFKGGSLENLYEAIQTQDVQYPTDIPISGVLRSILDRLLCKDPAKRPTSIELMHHPWVVEAEEERPAIGDGEVELELTRMDDAPSLAKWMNDLVTEEQTPLQVANEVAASVFGHDILDGAQSITTQNIMGVIQESNADGVAMPLLISLRPDASETHWGLAVECGDSPGTSSRSTAVEAAWQQQRVVANAAGSPPASELQQQQQQRMEGANGMAVRGLDAPPSWCGQPPQPASPMPSNLEPAATTEDIAATLECLLGSLSGEEFSLAGNMAPQRGGKFWEADAAADAAAAAPPSDKQQGSMGPRPVTPFTAAARAQPPSGAKLWPTQLAGPSAAASAPMSIPGGGVAVRPPLPISPFESIPIGSAPTMDLPHSPLSRYFFLNPPRDHDQHAVAPLARIAPGPATAPATGARLQSTGEVWDAMRSKALLNNTPGVKFVQFPAGAVLDIPEKAASNYCLLIESGIVDVRYVAVLEYHKMAPHAEQHRQGPAAGRSRRRNGKASVSSASKSGSDSEDEERRLERRDSVARGPEAQAVAPSKKHGSLAPSPSLQDTVDRVLARAQRVLASANSDSAANMLSTIRGPNDFLGIGAILEPAQHHKLIERWWPSLHARTEVRGVALSRQAVELVLKHYPLAQVYLRLTLSKGRAEILQLESLEKIASCLRPARPVTGTPSQRRRGVTRAYPSDRLDLFRAVSFARQLAAQLADQVTNLDPLADMADAAARLGHLGHHISRPDQSFNNESSTRGGGKGNGSKRSGSFFRGGRGSSVKLASAGPRRASTDGG